MWTLMWKECSKGMLPMKQIKPIFNINLEIISESITQGSLRPTDFLFAYYNYLSHTHLVCNPKPHRDFLNVGIFPMRRSGVQG